MVTPSCCGQDIRNGPKFKRSGQHLSHCDFWLPRDSIYPDWIPSTLIVSVFSFFFRPTQVRGDFLAFWEVWGLLPAFSRCPVGVVPHVVVFLMYLWGGRWSPCLTPPPSWRSLKIYVFLKIPWPSIPYLHQANNTAWNFIITVSPYI